MAFPAAALGLQHNSNGKLYECIGVTPPQWRVISTSSTGVIKSDGSVLPVADQSYNGNKITSLGSPTPGSQDAAPASYVDTQVAAANANIASISSNLSTNYVPISAIVNDLVTGGTNVPLSAEQGKVLNQVILTGVGTTTVYPTIAARNAAANVNNNDVAFVQDTGSGQWGMYQRVAGGWVLLISQAALATALGGALQRDGSNSATGNIPMGGNKLTGLSAGTTNGDSVRFEQLPLYPVMSGI